MNNILSRNGWITIMDNIYLIYNGLFYEMVDIYSIILDNNIIILFIYPKYWIYYHNFMVSLT